MSTEPSFGWFEDQINKAIDKAHSIIDGARHMDCAKASGGAYSGGYFLEKLGARLAVDHPDIGGFVALIGGAAEGLGATLGAGAAAAIAERRPSGAPV